MWCWRATHCTGHIRSLQVQAQVPAGGTHRYQDMSASALMAKELRCVLSVRKEMPFRVSKTYIWISPGPERSCLL